MRKFLRNIKFLCLLMAINLLSLSQVVAECTIDSGESMAVFEGKSGHIIVTQIFTACQTGPFELFSFKLSNYGEQAKDVSVTIAPYTSDMRLASSVFDLGTFDIIPKNGNKEAFTFTPTNSYEVKAGETYQISMTMNVAMPDEKLRGAATGRNLGGGFQFLQTTPSDEAIGIGAVEFLRTGFSSKSTGRMMPALAFNIQIGNSTVVTPIEPIEPIPTMNQWGLIIFGLLLLNLSLYFLHKKNLIFRK